MPLSKASCFISSILTGIPAFKKFMAIPPPMVPAPMMATEFTARNGVSAGTSGIFEAALSAMNKWRSDLLSGVNIRFLKMANSAAMPASNFICVALRTASTHFIGAG